MELKHKPATPLPWVETERLQEVPINGHFIQFRSIENVDYDAGGGVALVHEKPGIESNSAYISHAANAYPKLVEALRACIKGMPHNPPQDNAVALMKELGEDS